MKVLLAIISYMYCISQGSGYFYPICDSKDKTCASYFTLPSFDFLSFPSANKERDEEISKNEQPAPKTSNSAFEFVDSVLTPINVFYVENIRPVCVQIYDTARDYAPAVTNFYVAVLKQIPFLKYEEKTKTDSRLYFLFIITSLGIYLVLYIYFTRKLYFYYQGSLREQYLRNVKKIFKTPESSQ